MLHQLVTDRVNLRLEIFDYELVRLPSFKCNIQIHCFHPWGEASFTSSGTWFEIAEWNKFVASLNPFHEEASIDGMSPLSSAIKLKRKNIQYIVSLQFKEHMTLIGEMDLNFKYKTVYEEVERFSRFAYSVKAEYNS